MMKNVRHMSYTLYIIHYNIVTHLSFQSATHCRTFLEPLGAWRRLHVHVGLLIGRRPTQ